MTSDHLPRCRKCGGEPMMKSGPTYFWGNPLHRMYCSVCGNGSLHSGFELQNTAIQEWRRMNKPDENEWVMITDPDHRVRSNVDEVRQIRGGTWSPAHSSVNYRVADWPGYKFRCRRKDLPATPEPQQNKFVGHICRLRNGDVTESLVSYVKDSNYCLCARVCGRDISWTETGSYSGLASEHSLDIVGIVDETKPVHPMCAEMSESQVIMCPILDNGDNPNCVQMKPAVSPAPVAPPEPPPLKLEYGKRYVNRRGDIRGPLVETPSHWSSSSMFPFYDPDFMETFRKCGETGYPTMSHALGGDLVAEYVEPETHDSATRLKQLEAVVEAATEVLNAASEGDHHFVACLRSGRIGTTELRSAIVKLGDVMREVRRWTTCNAESGKD